MLGQDPYFVVRQEEENKQPLVKLRISRLSKLIGNPDLIAAYRAPPEAEAGGSRCVLCAPRRAAKAAAAVLMCRRVHWRHVLLEVGILAAFFCAVFVV